MKRYLTLLRRLSRELDEIKSRVWAALSPADVRAFAWTWDAAAGTNQWEPEGDWRVWPLLAGRGFGKTRSGSEWILEQARRHPGARIALVGATLEEVARVMVEGESGLLCCNPPGEKLKWSASRSELAVRVRGGRPRFLGRRWGAAARPPASFRLGRRAGQMARRRQ